jgi:hypothetical protein
MEEKTLRERLKEVLRGLDDEAIFNLWNDYCKSRNYCDDMLYSMDDFDEIFASYTPTDIAHRCWFGHDEDYDNSSFNPTRDYFYFNGYANPVSLNYLNYNSYRGDYLFSRFDELCVLDWLEENKDYCEIGEIAEVFSEYEEEDQDE